MYEEDCKSEKWGVVSDSCDACVARTTGSVDSVSNIVSDITP